MFYLLIFCFTSIMVYFWLFGPNDWSYKDYYFNQMYLSIFMDLIFPRHVYLFKESMKSYGSGQKMHLNLLSICQNHKVFSPWIWFTSKMYIRLIFICPPCSHSSTSNLEILSLVQCNVHFCCCRVAIRSRAAPKKYYIRDTMCCKNAAETATMINCLP